MIAPTLEAERAAPTLAPCPFCNGHSVETWPRHWGFWSVRCADCEIQGPSQPTEIGAAAAWNRRAAPSAEGVALPPRQSIGDDLKFCELLAWVVRDVGQPQKSFHRKNLIAYIDARTARAALEGYVLVPEVPTEAMIVAIERKVDE